MTVRDAVKNEIDALPDEALPAVREFLVFQKYRAILETGDEAYLNAMPGMAASIREGIETPLQECVPLSEVWPGV